MRKKKEVLIVADDSEIWVARAPSDMGRGLSPGIYRRTSSGVAPAAGEAATNIDLNGQGFKV